MPKFPADVMKPSRQLPTHVASEKKCRNYESMENKVSGMWEVYNTVSYKRLKCLKFNDDTILLYSIEEGPLTVTVLFLLDSTDFFSSS